MQNAAQRARAAGEWRSAAVPTWCSGCGNYKVLESLERVLAGTGWQRGEVCLVGGIGQAAKTVQYASANYIHGLHGRALPTALGVKLANHRLKVIAVGGDGDMYGEGGGHLVHALRRNIGVICLVHNNGVYGLTKGQPAPTSERGFATKAQPGGTLLPAFNPMAAAIAAGGTFVARAFAGDGPRLERVLADAFAHRGFALVDILQPCVTYNRVNTYQWFSERVYDLQGEGHDSSNVESALARAWDWPGGDRGAADHAKGEKPKAKGQNARGTSGEVSMQNAEGSAQVEERIPTGVFLRVQRAVYEEQLPALGERALTEQATDPAVLARVIEEFR
ncbi:MAG: thiamine pyrophosphate-dependent enzyme [bacterium]